MTKDKALKLALEAGFAVNVNNDPNSPRFKALAALVRADEREACALIAENHPAYDWHKAPCEITYAIRARGNT